MTFFFHKLLCSFCGQERIANMLNILLINTRIIEYRPSNEYKLFKWHTMAPYACFSVDFECMFHFNVSLVAWYSRILVRRKGGNNWFQSTGHLNNNNNNGKKIHSYQLTSIFIEHRSHAASMANQSNAIPLALQRRYPSMCSVFKIDSKTHWYEIDIFYETSNWHQYLNIADQILMMWESMPAVLHLTYAL